MQCKKNPVFPDNNPYDPTSTSYTLSSPAAFNAFINSEGIKLSWSSTSSDYFTGYLVYRARDNEELQLISELAKEDNEYIDSVNWNLIDVHYRLQVYYDPEDGERILSDTVSADIYQHLYSANAYWYKSSDIFIDMNDNFSHFSEFTVEQKIGDSPFELLGNANADNDQLVFNYSEYPEDKISFKIYVENDFTRTPEIIVTAQDTISPPSTFIMNQTSESEISIRCLNYNEPASELILYQDAEGDSNYVEIDRIDDCSSPFEVSGLSYENSYYFKVSARKGPYYSNQDSYFNLHKTIGPTLEIERDIVTDELSIIEGGITSDQKYAAFTRSDQEQYVIELENLQDIYINIPKNRTVITQVFEFEDQAFFSSLLNLSNSTPAELYDFETQNVIATIPTPSGNGFITEMTSIKNTPYVVFFSIDQEKPGEWTYIVSVYDYMKSEFVETLVNTSEYSYFRVAASDKSIVVYEEIEDQITVFSLSDFSETGSISINTNGVSYIESENDPDLRNDNTDYYYFKDQFEAVFRIDMNNPAVEYIDLQNGSNSIYQYGSSNNGKLKCAVINSFSESVLNCYDHNFNKQLTIDPESLVAGFLLSDNDEFAIVFTDKEIQKYQLRNSKWTMLE